jgi:hypothetical protein
MPQVTQDSVRIEVDGEQAWVHPTKRYLHNTTGPARVLANGKQIWYLEGKIVKVASQEEFENYIKENNK